MKASELRAELQSLVDPSRAQHAQRFFKCGPGEYGFGDEFLGISMPDQRKLVRKYRDLELSEISKLIKSKIHEHRMCALLIVTSQYSRSKSATQRQELFDYYLAALDAGHINNWDLVDVTAPTMGAELISRSDAQDFLQNLATSADLWHRRTAVLFSFAFLKIGQTQVTLYLAKLLLSDHHDLMHKAVGWALREVGKRNRDQLESFIAEYGKQMPRTALRYAIEHFPEPKRQAILSQTR